MKINELKKIAEKNEYELTECLEQYEFVRRSEIFYHHITISKVRANGLWIFIKVWCDDKDFNMIKAAVEFAETPIKDREEEKKFYLRHRWLKPKPIYKNYLNHWIGTNKYWLDYNNETENIQTQFTLKEIDEIKEKFNTDLGDFEKIEVKE